ncbi:MAG: amidohydrolase family protein [Candidatus Nezhaarchaeota archaeon]|nr:amidohydrolase family protein [Candidatus Nezhaarchaeota archaeon]
MIEVEEVEVRVIDAHIHPPDALEYGHRYPSSFNPGLVGELLARMDEAGVDLAVMFAIELDPERYEGFMEGWDPYSRSMARIILRTVNTPCDEVSKYVELGLGRIIGFGSVNPHLSEEEVEVKIGELKDRGFRGLKLLPTIQFFNPADERFDAIFRTAEREGLIVTIHSGCDPGPWENPELSENARPRLIGEVAARHPSLKLVIAHMGSYSALRPGLWFEEAMKVAEGRPNVYVDTAAVFSERLVREAVRRLGEDRVLFGSDYPAIGGFCDRASGMANCVKWAAALGLPLSAKKKLLGENAARLLKL